MAGLARICKFYGRMQVGDLIYVWDYVADKAVMESDMPFGSDRWKDSERAKFAAIKEQQESDERMWEKPQ